MLPKTRSPLVFTGHTRENSLNFIISILHGIIIFSCYYLIHLIKKFNHRCFFNWLIKILPVKFSISNFNIHNYRVCRLWCTVTVPYRIVLWCRSKFVSDVCLVSRHLHDITFVWLLLFVELCSICVSCMFLRSSFVQSSSWGSERVAFFVT